MGIAPLITDSKLGEMYKMPSRMSKKIKKPKEPEFQKECAYCSYWTGVGRHAFKCYCGSCPAKFRDESKKRKAKEEKKRRRK